MNKELLDNIPILKIINNNFLDENNKKYPLNYKYNDDLLLIFNEEKLLDNFENIDQDLYDKTKSVLIDRKTLSPIYSHFNNMILNKEATNILKNTDWNTVSIEKSYEGTTLVIYYHNDSWMVSTRRCIDSKNSKWIYGLSYYDMFIESIQNKFSLDDLDKNYCYHFILVHYKNVNIINYKEFGSNYTEVIHIMTTTKNECLEIDYTINNNVKKPEKQNFNSLNDLLMNLNSISYSNELEKKINFDGYIIKQYSNKEKKGYFIQYKLQTELYIKLSSIKPNNSNINQCFLELYQKDLLQEFLPYVSNYHYDIIKRINFSFKTITREILNIYHNTRKKKNPFLYENLKDTYKKIIYGLHGIYINNKKKNFSENLPEDTKFKSITVHNVYYYIKNLDPKTLRNLFLERTIMINEAKILDFIDKDCIFCKTQTILMFGSLLNNKDYMTKFTSKVNKEKDKDKDKEKDKDKDKDKDKEKDKDKDKEKLLVTC